MITCAWKRGFRRRRDATPSPIKSMTPRFWRRVTGTLCPCPLPFTEMTLRASWARPRLIQLRLPFGPLHSCAAVSLTDPDIHAVRTSPRHGRNFGPSAGGPKSRFRVRDFSKPVSRSMWSPPGSVTLTPDHTPVYAHVVSDQLTEAADIFARSVAESVTVVSKIR